MQNVTQKKGAALMNEDYITFDFANGKIMVHNSGETGTLDMPDLAEKRSAIYAAAGLDQIDSEELRSDLRNLFQSLGLNIEV